MEKKLTDEEIVKALDNCITEYTDMNRHSCDTCPYKGIEPCGKAQMIDCLDLIHRLQDENKRLKDEKYKLEQNLGQCENGYQLELHTAKYTIAQLQEQVDELTEPRNKNYLKG